MSLPPLPPVQSLSAEWAVLKYLDGFAPDDIRFAIRNNVRLAQLLTSHWNAPMARLIRSLAHRYGNELHTYLDPANVSWWLSQRRPALHQAVASEPGGDEWLRSNFAEVRAALGI